MLEPFDPYNFLCSVFVFCVLCLCSVFVFCVLCSVFCDVLFILFFIMNLFYITSFYHMSKIHLKAMPRN